MAALSLLRTDLVYYLLVPRRGIRAATHDFCPRTISHVWNRELERLSTMTLAIILVVAAVLALIFILSITVSRSLQVSNTSLAGRIQPLDLEAFRNLTDAAEDEYLRCRLATGRFSQRPSRASPCHGSLRPGGRAERHRAGAYRAKRLAANDPRPPKRHINWSIRRY